MKMFQSLLNAIEHNNHRVAFKKAVTGGVEVEFSAPQGKQTMVLTPDMIRGEKVEAVILDMYKSFRDEISKDL